MSEQCAECGNTYRSSLVWKSELTNFMVENLSDDALSELIHTLDKAVMNAIVDFGVGQ